MSEVYKFCENNLCVWKHENEVAVSKLILPLEFEVKQQQQNCT